MKTINANIEGACSFNVYHLESESFTMDGFLFQIKIKIIYFCQDFSGNVKVYYYLLTVNPFQHFKPRVTLK